MTGVCQEYVLPMPRMRSGIIEIQDETGIVVLQGERGDWYVAQNISEYGFLP